MNDALVSELLRACYSANYAGDFDNLDFSTRKLMLTAFRAGFLEGKREASVLFELKGGRVKI